MFQLIDKKIRQAFSDAAIQYDVLTSLHKEIGRDLIKKIRIIEEGAMILDVGMGTGWLTNKIAFYFPEANVVGLDFAPGMIEEARKSCEDIEIIQADACQLPFQNQTFDFIVSNLAYQWVKDLRGAFQSSYTVLKEKGVLCFTAFGRKTLEELFISLEKSLDHKKTQPFYRLASREELEQEVYQAGFRDVRVDYERIKVRFPDMVALVKWIKGIGANTLKNGNYIGKDLINRASEYYNQHFKDRFGIYTTFEVIWVEAKK